MIVKEKVIISGTVESYIDETLKIIFDENKVGYCSRYHISDFEFNNIEEYFKKYPTYKFKIITKRDDGNYILSYKYAHPNLVKNKRNIIPTANHFNTLRRYVTYLLYNDDLKK